MKKKKYRVICKTAEQHAKLVEEYGEENITHFRNRNPIVRYYNTWNRLMGRAMHFLPNSVEFGEEIKPISFEQWEIEHLGQESVIDSGFKIENNRWKL